MTRCGRLDVELYHKDEPSDQAKYLVHGYDDVLWTDDIDSAVNYLKESLIQMEKECTFRKQQSRKEVPK